jgi:hypothetical protein
MKNVSKWENRLKPLEHFIELMDKMQKDSFKYMIEARPDYFSEEQKISVGF